jgi:DNA-binding response OmpR family regulator
MPRFLLVDDEALLAELLNDWLVELGHEVVGPVASVEDALPLIETEGNRLSGAILDVTLAHGDSYPIADELRRLGIPFAFATGHGVHGLDPRFRGAMTLLKPFVFDDLHAALTRMLQPASPAQDRKTI